WHGTDDVVLDLASGAHQLRVDLFQPLNEDGVWLEIAPTIQPATTVFPVVRQRPPRFRNALIADLENRLSAEIERQPTLMGPLLVRARFYARRGRLNEASKDFVSTLLIDPSNQETWVHSAIVALGSGNPDEYRRQCREMLSRFGTSTNRVA